MRFLAQATAPLLTVLPLSGGVSKRPAGGSEELLVAAEIAQLISMADDVVRALHDAELVDGITLLGAAVVLGAGVYASDVARTWGAASQSVRS